MSPRPGEAVKVKTAFGIVTHWPDAPEMGVQVRAVPRHLKAWASRPGAAWPCSVLASLPHGIYLRLDMHGDLAEIDGDESEEVMADELDAWLDDLADLADLPGRDR